MTESEAEFDTSRPPYAIQPQNLAALRYSAEHGALPDWFHADPTTVVLSLLDRIEELERHNRALLDHIKEDAPLGHG